MSESRAEFLSEPATDQPAVREVIDPIYRSKYECGTLGEVRVRIDSIDARIYYAVRDLLEERVELTTDAVRFKENLEQVTAVERQMVKLSTIQQQAEADGFLYPDLLVDVFDTIVTWSVERQRQAFETTRPIDN